MLDLTCQDSSYEKTMGCHEKNKHIVKWLTVKKELHEDYWETEGGFTERWKRNIHIAKKKKLRHFLQKKKESLQIKTLIYAQKKNQCHVFRQKHASVKYINEIFISQKINKMLL